MTSIQIQRIQQLLTEEQFQLFFRLSKSRNWLGEMYLDFILSQKQIDYIYHSETNICTDQAKSEGKRSPYLMR